MSPNPGPDSGGVKIRIRVCGAEQMDLTWANQITILRILLIMPFIICMFSINTSQSATFIRYCALAFFLIMCASDVLDGYMARVKKQVTRLGTFLDPLADKLLITCACILLAAPETAIKGFLLPLPVVVLIIGKDVVLLLGFQLIHMITGRIRIVPVFTGKLSTFIQLTMVAAVLVGPEFSKILPFWPVLVRLLFYTAAASAFLAMIVYIHGGIQYIKTFGENGKNADL